MKQRTGQQKQNIVNIFFIPLAVVIFTLFLAACQGTPTPSITQDVRVETEEPATGLTGSPTATQEITLTPSVVVVDQEILNGTVKIDSVVSQGPGWLVVHAQNDGAPGPILGYSQVTDGENSGVVVEIDAANATDTLYAMLHTDSGELGVFEFPNGADTPVSVDGQVVTPGFQVLASGSGATSDALIQLGGNDALGAFLTDAEGMTLYGFMMDEPGVSNCYDQCANDWPPVTLAADQALTAGGGVGGALSTTTREDGSVQVTYNGFPLYYWINDVVPGDTTGHGYNGVWAVVSPGIQSYSINPGSSQVSYEVGETFLNQNNRFNVAIGVTDQINGKVILDVNNPLSAWVSPITIDISKFTSDSDRRDSALRDDFLESAQYPFAIFTPRKIVGLPQAYSEGDQVEIQITGDLTVRDVTQPVTFDVAVGVENGVVQGVASTEILMSDFGVGPISILGILSTEDQVKLTFNFSASGPDVLGGNADDSINSNENLNDNSNTNENLNDNSNSNDDDNSNEDDYNYNDAGYE